MTIITPVTLACPSCRAEGSHYVTQSSNGLGWRQWSDGWGSGHYASTESGLLHCSSCDFVFPQAICEWRVAERSRAGTPRFLGRQRGDGGQDESGNEKRRDPTLLQRMARMLEKDAATGGDDGPTDWPSGPGFDRPWHSTTFGSLEPSYTAHRGKTARAALASSQWFGDGTEVILRLQWWWDWNALAREHAPTLANAIEGEAGNLNSLPGDLADNVARLVELLDLQEHGLIVAECHRRCGKYDAAMGVYAAADAPPQWTEGLGELSRRGFAGLVELPVEQWPSRE